MKQVKFLHTADLHLDSPMVGLRHLPKAIFHRLQKSTFTALKNIIDAAIKYQVDFVVIAGDLFDGEDRSIRAQAVLRNEMEKLADKGIKVYAIHGNHDHLGVKSLTLDFPENVHFFSEQVEKVDYKKDDGTLVHLYGFSYPERHVMERWIEKYQKIEGADFHVGLLHGHFEGVSDHGKYAPFRLSDLIEKDYDYWALGHIHKKAFLSQQPYIVYPGNPQGRNRKELGEKGAYIVSLSEAGSEVSFFDTADVIWDEAVIDARDLFSFNSLYENCLDAIDSKRREGKGVLLDIKIEGLNSGLSDVIEKIENGELLELLQEAEKEEDSFVWVHRLKFTEDIAVDRAGLIKQSDFYEELFSTIEQYDDLGNSLSPLFQHSQARRHLGMLSEREKEELVEDAERILLQMLLKN
ncbi:MULTISPECIES: metallophosphoesterase family protein [Mesobacillus]|uniref:metallophosphoesterase family protein n=1 Tax=Mesobacillus TaxID=2675231 RepID=UPI0017807112|nr:MULTISPECIES: DNA repair exonuclease [Mesobacillus]MCM3573373.1 DNA repair exonuclease [Mesobacillus subterraneus]UYZ23086.1 DNA repair exonuclease [Mesobacillus jeotgali]